MSKRDFLKDLENALQGEYSESFIREQVNYYEKYIDDETKKGKSEVEVLNELGSAYLIAKTIKQVNANDSLNNSKTNGNKEGSYDNYNTRRTSSENYNRKKGPFVYQSSTNTIGCIIGFLVFVILCLYILRALGYFVSWIFMSPVFVFLILIFITYYFMSRK